jgi:hypothetical protein
MLQWLNGYLDEKLTLVEFDWGFNPRLPRQACFELHTLRETLNKLPTAVS